MDEKQIVMQFKKMCEQSINPDLFSSLVENIIPALKSARKALAGDATVKKFPETMPENAWPIIDHASTGNPECCGCWVWTFDRTGENIITITCNECSEKFVLLKKGNIEVAWISKQEVLEFCDEMLDSIAQIQGLTEKPQEEISND